MLEYAEFLTVSPSSVTEANVQALRDVGWTDEDIIDIVHVTCLFNYLDRIADGLGIEIESWKRETTEALSFKDDASPKRYGTITETPVAS